MNEMRMITGIHTDPIELISFIISLYWCGQSLWGVVQAYRVWLDTRIPKYQYLRPMAMRKMRQQMFLLFWALTLVLSGVITIFLPVGDLQSSIRNYALTIVSMFGAYFTAVAHFEHRSTDLKEWNGEDRRHPNGKTEND